MVCLPLSWGSRDGCGRHDQNGEDGAQLHFQRGSENVDRQTIVVAVFESGGAMAVNEIPVHSETGTVPAPYTAYVS